jgi:AraC-like DNA-binding protein
MEEFYKKSLLAFILLLVVDALLGCFFIYRSYLSLPLLPAHGVRWRPVADMAQAGMSTIRIQRSAQDQLRVDFKLMEAAQPPFFSAGLQLEDPEGKLEHLDLTRYSTITFRARCAPANSLIFSLSTFDENLSKPGKFLTYRSPLTFFYCSEEGGMVSLDLTRLAMSEWWFDMMKLDLSRQGYKLDKVSKIVFGNGPHTPHNVDSYLEINEMVLHGRDYRYVVALAIIIAAGWLVFGIVFFRAHTRALITSVNGRLQKDLALVAYRQLTLEPHKDKEKASVLRYIATNYKNAELDLEGVVVNTGSNRRKVNEILKAELGMTFTSYLNKLRLSEATRLLIAEKDVAVAEIAYSVGYTNVSYFNRLFKEEYDSTPSAFRTLAAQQQKEPDCCPAGLPG